MHSQFQNLSSLYEVNNEELIDVFEGAIEMEESNEEKYPGDLITSMGQTELTSILETLKLLSSCAVLY